MVASYFNAIKIGAESSIDVLCLAHCVYMCLAHCVYMYLNPFGFSVGKS